MNQKYHYISDQISDFLSKNHSCSTLTELLIEAGVMKFDTKLNSKDLYGTFRDHPIRLAKRKGYQRSSESNNDVGVLALRELLVNSDEAVLENDYGNFDPQDYFNTQRGLKSKYDIQNMIEARSKFSDPSSKDRKTQVTLLGASKPSLRTICTQDKGIGLFGEDFDNNFTYKHCNSTKTGIAWMNGLYGAGGTQSTRFQDDTTLRYKAIWSLRNPNLVGDELVGEMMKSGHIHLALNLVLEEHLFEDGGILADFNFPFEDRGYGFYSLEIQREDGSYWHPICSQNYSLNPPYAKREEVFKHGTLVKVYDIDIHRESNKVCNVSSKTSKFYDKGTGVNALASVLNSTHPEYMHEIGLEDYAQKSQRAESKTDSGGGSSRVVRGFERIITEDGFEFIDCDPINVNLFGTNESINVGVYLDRRDIRPEYKAFTAMNGVSFKLNDVYAASDSIKKVIHRYKIPKPLCDWIKIVFDFNDCSKKTKRKLIHVSRNGLNLDDATQNEIRDRGITQIHENSRIKELLAEYTSDNDNLESFDDKDFDLLSPLFVNRCKKQAPQPKANPNPSYDKTLTNIQINPNTLISKLLNKEKKKFKVIQATSKTYNLRFIHNVLGSIVQKYTFDINIATSTDSGKTWNEGISNTPIFHRDGELELKGIPCPSQNAMQSDKTFLTRVTLEPRNRSKWVDDAFTSTPIEISCMLDEVNINHSDKPRPRTKFSYGNGKSSKMIPTACPLDVKIIKDLDNLYEDDTKENLKYCIDVSDEENIRYMEEKDFLGFMSNGAHQIVVINASNQEYDKYRANKEDIDFIFQFLASKLKNKCIDIITRQGELKDLSAINDSFSTEIAYASELENKSIKQAVKARREQNMKNIKKSKTSKAMPLASKKKKKKPLAKKKSKQSA
jgi:hypothetical protein